VKPWLHALLPIAAVIAACAWAHQHTPTLKASATTLPPWSGLTVSKSTTLLTEPLRPDGTVDYLAAINQRSGSGVSEENNAVVALLPLIGTKNSHDSPIWGWGSEAAAQLAALGTAPEHGLVVEWKYEAQGEGDARVQNWMRVGQQRATLELQPWTSSSAPEIDTWVEANTPCFPLLEEASRRPKWFVPCISKDGSLSSQSISRHLGPVGEAFHAFRMRAMRHLGDGDAAAAWHGLAIAHRLAHLVSQEYLIVPNLVALGWEASNHEADLAIIEDSSTPRTLISTMLAELQALPAMPDAIEIFERREVYDFPAAVQSVAAGMKKKLDALSPKEKMALKELLTDSGLFFPDWNRIARSGNSFNESIYTVPPIHTAAEWRAWTEHRHALMQNMLRAGDKDRLPGDDNILFGGVTEQFLWPRVGETRDTYSDRLTRMLLSLTCPSEFLTDVEKKRIELTPLACALVLYRLDHGGYPDSANQAAAEYHLILPKGFWGRPVEYTRKNTGFTLEVWPPEAETLEHAQKKMIRVEIHRP